MSKRYIVATVFRKNKPIEKKHYARLLNALRRSAELAILEYYPGDKIEFTLRESEILAATAWVSLGGNFRWDLEDWVKTSLAVRQRHPELTDERLVREERPKGLLE